MTFSFIKNSYHADQQGLFGQFGGQYVPELLIPALQELEQEYLRIQQDPDYMQELTSLFQNYSGRPTPLYHAERLSTQLGGAQIFIKNEGLNHTGAHKINHCLGQILMAKKMGKTRIIAETGAGQHGLATASVAAKFGMECVVYMGEIDVKRQHPNVFWMRQMGATVVPVTHGTKTLKDAVTAAIQDWITNIDDSYYLLGSALGPHPYPSMVRDFQSIIGIEVQQQLQDIYAISHPDYLVACVGGGSNAMGLFNNFLDDSRVTMIGVEAGGKGTDTPGNHATRMTDTKKLGVVEGYKSYFLQNQDGQVQKTHSISAGLDYAGIGPEHAYLDMRNRVSYTHATDAEVLEAFTTLARTEGIIGALESLHAVAHVIRLAPTLSVDTNIVVNLSGRGEKDLFIYGEQLGGQEWKNYLHSHL